MNTEENQNQSLLVAKEIGELKVLVAKEFGELKVFVAKEFGELKGQVSAITKEIGGLQGRFSTLERSIGSLENKVQLTHEAVQELSGKFDEFAITLQATKEEIETTKCRPPYLAMIWAAAMVVLFVLLIAKG